MTANVYISTKMCAYSWGPWFHKGLIILVWFLGLFIYSSLSDLFCLFLCFIGLPEQIKMSFPTEKVCPGSVCGKKPSRPSGLQSWHPPTSFYTLGPYIFVWLIWSHKVWAHPLLAVLAGKSGERKPLPYLDRLLMLQLKPWGQGFEPCSALCRSGVNTGLERWSSEIGWWDLLYGRKDFSRVSW